MREGYGSQSVYLSVIMAICNAKVKHHGILYGIFKVLIVWILLKMLFQRLAVSYLPLLNVDNLCRQSDSSCF